MCCLFVCLFWEGVLVGVLGMKLPVLNGLGCVFFGLIAGLNFDRFGMVIRFGLIFFSLFIFD